jgi:lysine biosynthesis protein LysW
MLKATCPSCGDEVAVRSDADIGDEVLCPHCGEELEVMELEPLELSWAYYDDDDDDDDGFDDD